MSEIYEKHRFLNKLDEGIEKGFNSFYLYGMGVDDYYFMNLYLGIRKLKSSLLSHFTSLKNIDVFVHLKDKNINYYDNKGIKRDKNIIIPPKTKGGFGSNISTNDIQGNDVSTEEVASAQSIATNSELDNQLFDIEKIMLENKKKIVFFIEGFEWIASLYDSAQKEITVPYIKRLRNLTKSKKSITIVSLKNLKPLEEYDIEIDPELPNMISLANPSVKEIEDVYTRYLYRNYPDIEIDFEELEKIASGLQSSKYNLRNCMRILKKVIKNNPSELNFSDFKDSITKIINEEIDLDKDVILDERTKNEVIEYVENFVNNKENKLKGIILTGPSGTGKTLLAKAIAQKYNINYIAPTLSELKGEYIGQSSGKVKRFFENARANAPTIVFLDELDSIFMSRSGDSDSYVKDMINEFLVQIDGLKSGKDDIFIIGATNRITIIDPAIISRLSPLIKISLPSKTLRDKIFNSKFKDFNFSSQIWKDEVLDKTEGFSGRDIDKIVKIIKKSDEEENAISLRSFRDALIRFENEFINIFRGDLSGKIEIKDNTTLNYKNIIGYENIKRRLSNETMYIKDAEIKLRARKSKIEPLKSTLLYGPPGNGKTFLAEAIAGENDFYFIKVLSRDFSSSFVEEQLKKIDLIFSNAIKLSKMTSKKGVLLFFDEFDSLAGPRMDSMIRGTLLDHIANKNRLRHIDSRVMLIAATNFKDSLDEATIRKGRFDIHIEMGNPVKESGLQILRNFFEKDEYLFSDNKDEEFYKNLYDFEKENKINSEGNKEMNEFRVYSNRSEDLSQIYNNWKENLTLSISEIENLYKETKNNAFFNNKYNNEGKLVIS